MKEKDRIAKKKLELMKKEKKGIISEFKNFSASFKVSRLFCMNSLIVVQLNTPVPADLAEILKKDKKKEEEGETAQAESADGSHSPVKSPAPAEQSSGMTPATAPAKSKSSFKFNLSAREFKPSPAAPEFVPSV